MVRMLGGILILSGSVGLGMWYRARFIESIRVKQILVEILERLMSEVRYGNTALPECCKRLGEQMEDPYGKGFREIACIYREAGQVSFAGVFVQVMGQCLAGLPLKKEERDIFLEAFRQGGFQDKEMQLKCFERSRDRLLTCIRSEEKTLPGKCRMALSLGGMSGLIMIIVLL